MQGYTRVLRNAKTQLVQMNASLGAMPAAALAGITAGFVALLKAVTTVGIKMDGFNNSMLVSTGSFAGARREIEKIRRMTDKLGINFMSTADAYKKFSIAASEVGMEAKTADKVFNSVAKASAAMGLSAENTRLTLKALEQMISKGTVQSEELRGQLGEHLPGAFGMAAKAIGVTTAELSKMLEQGKVLAIDLLPKLADVLENKFSKTAEIASKQMSASVNRMSNAWNKLLEEFSQTDAYQAVRKGVEGVTKSLKDLSVWVEMGGLDAFFKDMRRHFDFLVLDLMNLKIDLYEFTRDAVGAFSEFEKTTGVLDKTGEKLIWLGESAIVTSKAIITALASIANGFEWALKSATKLTLTGQTKNARVAAIAYEQLSDGLKWLAAQFDSIDDSAVKGVVLSMLDLSDAFSRGSITAEQYGADMKKLNDQLKHLKGEDSFVANQINKSLPALEKFKGELEELKSQIVETGGASSALTNTINLVNNALIHAKEVAKAYNEKITTTYALTEALADEQRNYTDALEAHKKLVDGFSPDVAPEENASKKWWDMTSSAETFHKELKHIHNLTGSLEEQTAQFMDRFIDDWSKRLVDGIASGKASMADFAKSTLKMIGQMIVKALLWRAVMGLAKVAVGALGGGYNGATNEPLFSTAGTNIANLPAPYPAFNGGFKFAEDLIPMPELKAKGGSVSSQTPYIVGERGAELFVPRTSGTIVPNDKLGASQQDNSSLNITFQINAVDTQSGTAFLMKNQKHIVGMIDQAYRKQGRTGVTA
jgi:tape measure domain-containing protein